ncbi:hypothetical protein C8R14_12235 [Nitrosomonas eutropha]|uniref:Secreted protein n=1 Tax=Nitrosomonas eutropha TaxID=916 RepID=A0ABX5M702_9PROT|nr:hypothetical protein C8R14_12235 [Nitrosomonas eutropha]SEJ03186.1 hypothetical protein SAMN05216318_12116 [Nitrosomonas eutropha]
MKRSLFLSTSALWWPTIVWLCICPRIGAGDIGSAASTMQKYFLPSVGNHKRKEDCSGSFGEYQVADGVAELHATLLEFGQWPVCGAGGIVSGSIDEPLLAA